MAFRQFVLDDTHRLQPTDLVLRPLTHAEVRSDDEARGSRGNFSVLVGGADLQEWADLHAHDITAHRQASPAFSLDALVLRVSSDGRCLLDRVWRKSPKGRGGEYQLRLWLTVAWLSSGYSTADRQMFTTVPKAYLTPFVLRLPACSAAVLEGFDTTSTKSLDICDADTQQPISSDIKGRLKEPLRALLHADFLSHPTDGRDRPVRGLRAQYGPDLPVVALTKPTWAKTSSGYERRNPDNPYEWEQNEQRFWAPAFKFWAPPDYDPDGARTGTWDEPTGLTTRAVQRSWMETRQIKIPDSLFDTNTIASLSGRHLIALIIASAAGFFSRGEADLPSYAVLEKHTGLPEELLREAFRETFEVREAKAAGKHIVRVGWGPSVDAMRSP